MAQGLSLNLNSSAKILRGYICILLTAVDNIILEFTLLFSWFLLKEADMKREMERKEQERKKSPKVDFVPGSTQPGTVASAPKISTQIAGMTNY